MIRRNILLVAIFAFASLLHAQGGLKEQAEFSFKYPFQSSEGTNASAVAWVPTCNCYYTVIAGNADFPLEAFDGSGNPVFQANAGKDLRGLWYNPKTMALEANAAGNAGWFVLQLDDKGMPRGKWENIVSGQKQPDFQSVLNYVAPKKKLVTFYADSFSFWSRKNQKEKVRFQHGTPVLDEWLIVPHTAAYTGNKAFPIAVLELNQDQILYFDLKGKYLGATHLPDGTFEIETFRFAFANGKAFLYNEDERTWMAYKVFN